MGIRDLLFVGLVLGGAAALTAGLYPPRIGASNDAQARLAGATAVADTQADADLQATVDRVDAAFRDRWASAGVTPAPAADDLVVARRLALALTGSIPSLEEIRSIQAMPSADRSNRYAAALLADRRSADYLAERFARAFVGTEAGPFLIYRRRRFVSWLSDRLMDRAPYDAIVRDLIASDGLWTDHPATNFLTVTHDPETKSLNPERLAGRVSRAFLGARIDCAQCHNHPFADWKQADFQGLAAFFGKAESGLTGIHEGKGEFQPIDRKTGKPVTVAPHVPYRPELLPPESAGNRRVRLARWTTDPANPNFARATVNRAWALMFGKPLVEPVDDLPADPAKLPAPLLILADDFVTHGHDLTRLFRAIAATEAFRIDGALPGKPDDAIYQAAEREWAVFPMTRLRPEQVAGSLLQAGALTTIDTDSPFLVRLITLLGEQGFIKRFGDTGEDEFDARGGTIPQRLLMMNGELVVDKTKAGPFNAPTRIGWFAATDREAVEVAYLAFLSRRPDPAELQHFTEGLRGARGDDRSARMADMAWALINATEFSWNH